MVYWELKPILRGQSGGARCSYPSRERCFVTLADVDVGVAADPERETVRESEGFDLPPTKQASVEAKEFVAVFVRECSGGTLIAMWFSPVGMGICALLGARRISTR